MSLDLAAEKTEKALKDGIEHFDQTKLKHTETTERNVLPDNEGLYFLLLSCTMIFFYLVINFVDFA